MRHGSKDPGVASFQVWGGCTLIFDKRIADTIDPCRPALPNHPIPRAKVDETQANLAFVALRKEPFLMEEFGHLASEIQLLHEVRRREGFTRKPGCQVTYHTAV